MKADVVIIGAGVVGAACARSLSMAGQSVVVIDRGSPVAGTSASGEGNLLLSDKIAGDELRLAQYSLGLWPSVVLQMADELGPGFPSLEFERKGGLVVATTESGAAPLIAFAEGQRSAGIDARPLDVADAIALEPDLNPGITAAVYYPQDAQVQPVIAAEAMLAVARRRGALVRPGTEVVSGIRAADGRLTGVRTADGDIHCDSTILAAGPWSGEVASRLGVVLPVRPRRGMVLVTSRMPHRIFHKVYDADYVGGVESSAADLQTSSVVESTAAGTVLIGSSRQRIGFDDRLQVAVLTELADKALRLFPFLAGASAMRTYGGFRPYMPDHLPVIGADHRMPGLFHATGHEGAGIGLSVGTAELILAAVLGTHAPIDAAAFGTDRASLRPYLEAKVA
jgi:D-hydroxyproline dehydrogenase subunit beta